nr:glycosyltransferase [Methylomarinum sp. Ch1-1]MDP4521201.1 glycosyltransferase [Methylomarinum sp. Ch1-1]
MPCFNGSKHIWNSISSVLHQTFTNLELIVVNDGSTDNTLEILNTIEDNRLWVINQKNAGVCKARNNGLKAAKGEFIAFLDADDTWAPDCLSKLYQGLINHPHAALAYCGWQNIGLTGGQGKPFIPPNYELLENKKALLFENCRWPIHATLTRRLAIEEAGLFDERLLTSEDFLLWLKIGTRHQITLVPEVLAYYHHHDGVQATKNSEKTAINHWLAQQLFIKENKTFSQNFDTQQLRKLMHGELLRRGYECYWKRDLKAARTIFRSVMKNHYGSWRDWKYMLPSLLPYQLHRALIEKMDSTP